MKKNAKKILVTAGPTREYLDPVRYFSNDSSGQMGFSLALAAARIGHKVVLISGPVSLKTPPGVRRLNVISARDMQSAVMKEAKNADVIVMAAAVSDWKPARRHDQKIKKGAMKLQNFSVFMEENPDILKELGKRKNTKQILVGFSLETNDLKKNAISKLKTKNCDWIIANKASAIGAHKNSGILFGRDGSEIMLPVLHKRKLAALILSSIGI